MRLPRPIKSLPALLALSAGLVVPAGAGAAPLCSSATLTGAGPCPPGPHPSAVAHAASVISLPTHLLSGLVSDGASALADGAASATLGVLSTAFSGAGTKLLALVTHLIINSASESVAAPWFSAIYWRVAGVGALLTLPFLFVSAAGAVFRGDLQPLTEASFVYLPMAFILVGVAAPLVALLMQATDVLCGVVTTAAGETASGAWAHAGELLGSVGERTGSDVIGLLAGAMAVAAALVLWLELLARNAAVFMVVLMLPLVFAGLVWPARRVWTIRALEVLAALILSKFVVVAVLALGGAGLASSIVGASISGALTAIALIAIACLAPWMVMRLLPHVDHAAVAGGFSEPLTQARGRTMRAAGTLAALAAAPEAGSAAGPETTIPYSDPGAEPPGQPAAPRSGPPWPSAPGSGSRSPLPQPQDDLPAPDKRSGGDDPSGAPDPGTAASLAELGGIWAAPQNSMEYVIDEVPDLPPAA